MIAAVKSPHDEEDSSIIKCVCGYQDDDGSTVLCEECNSWQHIECYYPDTDVPEIHECIDCDPRPLDADAATKRQRSFREERTSSDRKSKRSQTKTTKKKTPARDSSASASATTAPSKNGVVGHERKHSSSPKLEALHPSKRPKTAHRVSSSSTPVSGSIIIGTNLAATAGTVAYSTGTLASSTSAAGVAPTATGNSPGTTNSTNTATTTTTTTNTSTTAGPVTTADAISTATSTTATISASSKRRSITASTGKTSADTSSLAFNGDLFSPQFMLLHRQPDFHPVDVNTYTDLGITNSLHTWLIDPLELAQVTNGLSRDIVFATIGGFDELDQRAPKLQKLSFQDKSILVHGEHPIVQWLVIETAIPENAFIGELKGRIGRKEDYFENRDNRWDTLRHPEPFVFFPPFLPIYLDSRSEGSMLRYIRRSCKPNLKMQILIHDATYHFCFISTRPIEAGEELTMTWDIDETARDILSKSVSNGHARTEGIHGADNDYLSDWVTGILVNFGGCACSPAHGVCLLERFDRRNSQWKENTHAPSRTSPATTVTRPKRSKKTETLATMESPSSSGVGSTSRAGSESVAKDSQTDLVDSSHVSELQNPLLVPTTSVPDVPTTTSAFGRDMSASELRKLKQSERLFQQALAKRKRMSGGLPEGQNGHLPISTPKSARIKASKQTKSSTNRSLASSKSQFVDAAVQTDPILPSLDHLSPYRPLEKEKRSKLPLQTPRWRLYNFWKNREIHLVAHAQPQGSPSKTTVSQTPNPPPSTIETDTRKDGSTESETGINPVPELKSLEVDDDVEVQPSPSIPADIHSVPTDGEIATKDLMPDQDVDMVDVPAQPLILEHLDKDVIALERRRLPSIESPHSKSREPSPIAVVVTNDDPPHGTILAPKPPSEDGSNQLAPTDVSEPVPPSTISVLVSETPAPGAESPIPSLDAEVPRSASTPPSDPAPTKPELIDSSSTLPDSIGPQQSVLSMEPDTSPRTNNSITKAILDDSSNPIADSSSMAPSTQRAVLSILVPQSSAVISQPVSAISPAAAPDTASTPAPLKKKKLTLSDYTSRKKKSEAVGSTHASALDSTMNDSISPLSGIQPALPLGLGDAHANLDGSVDGSGGGAATIGETSPLVKSMVLGENHDVVPLDVVPSVDGVVHTGDS